MKRYSHKIKIEQRSAETQNRYEFPQTQNRYESAQTENKDRYESLLGVEREREAKGGSV